MVPRVRFYYCSRTEELDQIPKVAKIDMQPRRPGAHHPRQTRARHLPAHQAPDFGQPARTGRRVRRRSDCIRRAIRAAGGGRGV